MSENLLRITQQVTKNPLVTATRMLIYRLHAFLAQNPIEIDANSH